MDDVQFLDDLATEHLEKSDDMELKKLSSMVDILAEKRKQISLMEDQLKQAKAEERKIGEEEIPTFMLSKGLTAITTESGFKVSVKEELKAYLPKEPIKRSVALKWVVANDGEGIIKDKIEVEEPEQSIVTYLNENNIPYRHIRDINNRTLVAYMKGLLGISKGSLQTVELSEIPAELGAYVYNKTTIK